MADAEHPVRRLQALDLRADGLRTLRVEMAERGELRARTEERAALEQRREETARALELTQGRERGLEGEVADAAARAKAVEDDLYSGRVSAPKELAALQAELVACRARQGGLEEGELELMEANESLVAELATLDESLRALDGTIAGLRAAIDAAEARIDADLDALVSARETLHPEVEPRLLAVYEKRRANARLGGVITTHLDGNGCGRCRVALPIVEVTRIRREGPDAYAICTHCQRVILV